ncbi:YopJ/AvrA family T3SS effector serine/threonine acetyltransferase [Bartonella sp. 220]|uniref:YopJ/AvrA family T3SS effector serine/threonine acetyltransferase n=1 Tax=Bartonella sp. 220B TaxID=2967260 RepID=UPI0022A965D4|nr:YopJ/AvrA family T3SS effector serine/threonine acetyltransferase [Bartonella sp. 220B]MCZ2158726.1 YopJ/AvrA family T3SS effector serine/threonine acetyltransferase [Bartonella sp. 220B]
MKPQDSKNTAQSSSQPQEGAIANAPLDNLPASLEQLNIEKEKNIPFQHEKLQEIIAELESDIADGKWFKGGHHYAETDLKLMPALIDQANRKYQGLNLKLVTTSQDLSQSIKEAIKNGISSSRLIVNTTDRGVHSVVIDHRTIEGKTSLIAFEPATLNSEIPLLLAVRIHLTVQRELPECHFSKVEMDIQRSTSECGIFSLALAKKLHIETEKLTRMHKDNIDGVLCKTNTTLPPDKVDPYLPASFYKHTQGSRRLEEYVKTNPEAENEKVNKKGETLTERFEKNLVTKEGKKVSVSLHRKRVTEYKALTM